MLNRTHLTADETKARNVARMNAALSAIAEALKARGHELTLTKNQWMGSEWMIAKTLSMGLSLRIQAQGMQSHREGVKLRVLFGGYPGERKSIPWSDKPEAIASAVETWLLATMLTAERSEKARAIVDAIRPGAQRVNALIGHARGFGEVYVEDGALSLRLYAMTEEELTDAVQAVLLRRKP